MVNGTKGRKGESTNAAEGTTTEPVAASVRVLQRWNVNRKRDVVLRLLRGESLDSLSRELAIEIPRLEEWRTQGLRGLEDGLRPRRGETDANRDLEEALQRLGELSMENELLRRRCGLARPSPSRRSKT